MHTTGLSRQDYKTNGYDMPKNQILIIRKSNKINGREQNTHQIITTELLTN